MDIFLAVGMCLASAIMGFMGVYVTLHPPVSDGEKWAWKIGFAIVAILACGLIAWQTVRNGDAQTALQKRLDSIDFKIGASNPLTASQSPSAPPSTSKPQNPTPRGEINLSIDGANIATPDSMSGSTEMALLVSALNHSVTSTVVNEYELAVTTADNIAHKAVFLRLGNKSELRWKSASGQETVIPANDALEDKTENNPIVGGGLVRGQLLFLLPGVPHDSVIDPRTKLTLSAQNSAGKRFSVTETIKDISER